MPLDVLALPLDGSLRHESHSLLSHPDDTKVEHGTAVCRLVGPVDERADQESCFGEVGRVRLEVVEEDLIMSVSLTISTDRLPRFRSHSPSLQIAQRREHAGGSPRQVGSPIYRNPPAQSPWSVRSSTRIQGGLCADCLDRYRNGTLRVRACGK